MTHSRHSPIVPAVQLWASVLGGREVVVVIILIAIMIAFHLRPIRPVGLPSTRAALGSGVFLVRLRVTMTAVPGALSFDG